MSGDEKRLTVQKTVDDVAWHQVAYGGNHTIALSDDGRVYALGKGRDGQLGLGPEVSSLETFTSIHPFDGLTHYATKIFVGPIQTAVLTRSSLLSLFFFFFLWRVLSLCVSFSCAGNNELYMFGLLQNGPVHVPSRFMIETRESATILDMAIAPRVTAVILLYVRTFPPFFLLQVLAC